MPGKIVESGAAELTIGAIADGEYLKRSGTTITSGVPAGGAAHNVLSATHGDTTADNVVRGDVIIGSGATPKWTRLAKGNAGEVLTMGANEPAWAAPGGGAAPLGLGDLVDPNADRIYFWDDGAGKSDWLACGDSVAITGTTLDAIQDIRTTAGPTFDHVHLGDNQVNTNTKARAYGDTNQTGIAVSTATKVTLNKENYDPGADFDTANYKYVAPVTGYYYVSYGVYWQSVIADSIYAAYVYKDGAAFASNAVHSSTAHDIQIQGSDIIYLAASSYLELYGEHFVGAGNSTIYARSDLTWLTVHLLSI